MAQGAFWILGPFSSHGLRRTQCSLLLERAKTVWRDKQSYMKGLSSFGSAMVNEVAFLQTGQIEIDFTQEKVNGVTIPPKVKQVLLNAGINKMILEIDIDPQAMPSRNLARKTMNAVDAAIPAQAVISSLRHLSLTLPGSEECVVLDLSRYSGIGQVVSFDMSFEQALVEISSSGDGCAKVKYVHKQVRNITSTQMFEEVVRPHLVGIGVNPQNLG